MRKMKTFICALLSALLFIACAACNNNKQSDSVTDTAGGSSGGGNTSTTESQGLPDGIIDTGIDDAYLPVVSDIKKYSGEVNVDMIFGKHESGWKAVKQAYQALQPQVTVNLRSHGGSDYATAIKQELQSDNTSLGVFAGNYVNTLVPTYGYDFKANALDTKNVYAGNKIWRDVLTTQAYTMNTSSTGVDTLYVMNSQSLETCWYINVEAFKAAGITDANGDALTPKTWNELISICERLKQNGYDSPLGLAGNADALTGTQFSWLFRIYGDQYYRDLLDDVQAKEGDWCYTKLKNGFDLDLNDSQPEADRKYNPNLIRVYNAVLEESTKYMDYVGPRSEKYKCFLENLGKIKPYISGFFSANSFDNVRDLFLANKADKSGPVILLDYVGFGLSFENDIKDAGDRKFSIAMFDYPYMECSHEKKHCTTDFVRDVGGNGGYISLYAKGRSVEEVEKYLDFIKFFMSPYGQSVFCNGMAKRNASPDGLTTVKHVVMSDSWMEYFNGMGEKWGVKFNGLCDMNPFQRMYSHGGSTSYSQAFGGYMQRYLSGADTLETAMNGWADKIVGYYEDQFSSKGYKSTCYKTPEDNPKS